MEKEIYIAGGCFWGVEAYFQQLKGVNKTEVGYAQGNPAIKPTYELVCTGRTGYTETVYMAYDDEIITLDEILQHMMRFVDPTSLNQQGNDVGTQYRSGVYYVDDADEEIVARFLEELQNSYDKPVQVENEKLSIYWGAEEYHQEYLDKNPNGYCHVNLNLVQQHERK